jgi:hypothetical protein
MVDKARPNRARVVQDYLEWESIERMDWSARSPDINPIKHMWNELQVIISARQMQLRTTQELGSHVGPRVADIPVRTIRNLIGSIKKRCQAFIDSNGSHARY